jgi:UDP-N-acetylmuramate-alanine ligase
MNVIEDLFFKINKPKVIMITGQSRFLAGSFISGILKNNFKTGKDLVIFESDLKDIEKIVFFAKTSVLFLLVAMGFENASETSRLEYSRNLKKVLKCVPENGQFLVNFDDENLRQIIPEFDKKTLTFGFGEGSDLMASDMLEDNFKMNYRGSTVPVWMDNISDKDRIYAALAAALCGVKLGMNLIEISQALKSFSATHVGRIDK